MGDEKKLTVMHLQATCVDLATLRGKDGTDPEILSHCQAAFQACTMTQKAEDVPPEYELDEFGRRVFDAQGKAKPIPSTQPAPLSTVWYETDATQTDAFACMDRVFTQLVQGTVPTSDKTKDTPAAKPQLVDVAATSSPPRGYAGVSLGANYGYSSLQEDSGDKFYSRYHEVNTRIDAGALFPIQKQFRVAVGGFVGWEHHVAYGISPFLPNAGKLRENAPPFDFVTGGPAVAFQVEAGSVGQALLLGVIETSLGFGALIAPDDIDVGNAQDLYHGNGFLFQWQLRLGVGVEIPLSSGAIFLQLASLVTVNAFSDDDVHLNTGYWTPAEGAVKYRF